MATKGVAVIDTLTAPIHAKAFIAAIRRVADKPFTQVFLAHHHGDPIDGTQYFEGAESSAILHTARDEVVKVARAGGPAFSARREGWADDQPEDRRRQPRRSTAR